MAMALILAGPSWAGNEYYDNVTVDFTGLDSLSGTDSTARETKTDSVSGSDPLFYYSGTSIYNSANGIAEVYILALDSDDAAAQIADTSQDSIIISIYTAWKNPWSSAFSSNYRSGENIVAACSLSTMGVGYANRQMKRFTIASGIGQVLYARILSIYHPVNMTDSVGIHYEVGLTILGKQ